MNKHIDLNFKFKHFNFEMLPLHTIKEVVSGVETSVDRVLVDLSFIPNSDSVLATADRTIKVYDQKFKSAVDTEGVYDFERHGSVCAGINNVYSFNINQVLVQNDLIQLVFCYLKRNRTL